MRDDGFSQEVEDLEEEIAKHERAMKSLWQKRKNVKKQMKSPLLRLLGVVLITAFLSYSCALHAGELLGVWEADVVIGLWTGPLEGIVAWAKSLGTAPYVIAAFVTGIINIPVMLSYMPLSLLRIIEMALEMNFPAPLAFLPYVEIALILPVFWVLLREYRPFGTHRELKAQLKDIDSQLQRHRDQQQQARDLLPIAKKTESLSRAEGKSQLEAMLADDEYMGRVMEDLFADELWETRVVESIPKGFDSAKRLISERYFRKDPRKTFVTAEAIKDVYGAPLEHGFEKKALTEEEYLADFDRVFQYLSDEDVSAALGIST